MTLFRVSHRIIAMTTDSQPSKAYIYVNTELYAQLNVNTEFRNNFTQ
uniref:Uncharacterized protein n=1 Tax=Anguilla anguilla TaxID=7936 RepID=A0A0E9W0G6_ANGAN